MSCWGSCYRNHVGKPWINWQQRTELEQTEQADREVVRGSHYEHEGSLLISSVGEITSLLRGETFGNRPRDVSLSSSHLSERRCEQKSQSQLHRTHCIKHNSSVNAGEISDRASLHLLLFFPPPWPLFTSFYHQFLLFFGHINCLPIRLPGRQSAVLMKLFNLTLEVH